MRLRPIAVILVLLILSSVAIGVLYIKNRGADAVLTSEAATAAGIAGATGVLPVPQPSGLPTPGSSPTVGASPTAGGPTATASPSAQNVDLAVDNSGLSKSTVIMTTTQGIVKFKFYPKDAPGTVGRIIELIQQGFYNGLTFHRVVPGFVIQGGDPLGTGAGGSGQKLKAEFNSRRHIEGTVAMARAQDKDSADSQFYISLGTAPHLDNNYTVFGQVIEGMDVAKRIRIGDKMTNVRIEN